ncbi:hypothetical protein [Paenarthrobacter sp. PH39-S1]|uniref:hypothetical protein n=1 Tax=Paenarthrobacter sp. PH39-S1 TaxID=3046204 RepID=UPI0024BBDA5C|nr:hypothetical protein [Paenarthrobacter sp. PH39-S1]MDJ0356257.1 hypothetical protein [Paenarthrobacter sp. PH39-S1]
MKGSGNVRAKTALLTLVAVLLAAGCGLPQGRGSTGGFPEIQPLPTPSNISDSPSAAPDTAAPLTPSPSSTPPAAFTGNAADYQPISSAPSVTSPGVSLDWLLDGVDDSLNRVYLTAMVPACNRPLQAIITEEPSRVVLTLAGALPTPGMVCPHNVAMIHGYVQLADPVGSRKLAPRPAG